ncbi:MAG: hypothetical protein NZ761_11140, partial [Dehalococcoidia bacterium]|nr:hypothetical protein [Dehalococcoidia bacterium]
MGAIPSYSEVRAFVRGYEPEEFTREDVDEAALRGYEALVSGAVLDVLVAAGWPEDIAAAIAAGTLDHNDDEDMTTWARRVATAAAGSYGLAAVLAERHGSADEGERVRFAAEILCLDERGEPPT